MRQEVKVQWLLLCLGLLVVSAAHLLLGAMSTYPVSAQLSALVRGTSDPGLQILVFDIRLPRTVAALVVGGTLGYVGCGFQTLFRNPLAEPYVLGVSGGAAVGGTLAVLLGFYEAFFGLGGVACATLGGILALVAVLRIGQIRFSLNIDGLVIAGIVVSAMLGSWVSLILLFGGHDTNQILRWLLGSLSTTFWPRNTIMMLVSAASFIAILRCARNLNTLALGPDTARTLGVDARRIMMQVLVFGCIATSTVVGSVGIVGFVGLVAPHFVRLLFGPDLRRSIPASAMMGALILTLSDLIAQRLVPMQELPVGAVTAALGAPALLWLIRKPDQNTFLPSR